MAAYAEQALGKRDHVDLAPVEALLDDNAVLLDGLLEIAQRVYHLVRLRLLIEEVHRLDATETRPLGRAGVVAISRRRRVLILMIHAEHRVRVLDEQAWRGRTIYFPKSRDVRHSARALHLDRVSCELELVVVVSLILDVVSLTHDCISSREQLQR